MKHRILIVFALMIALCNTAALGAIKLHRGVNISHWLSQSGARGTERANYFTEKDVAFIASQGFDHLRIPIDEEQMFTPDGEKEPEAFRLLHNALQWCRKYKMRAVVDLHILNARIAAGMNRTRGNHIPERHMVPVQKRRALFNRSAAFIIEDRGKNGPEPVAGVGIV